MFSATPLGLVPSPSRFSDPALEYAVLYAANTPRCAMVETIVRDRFAHRARPALQRVEIDGRSLVSLRGTTTLQLLDLTEGGAGRIGCPGAVLGDPRHAAGRALSAWLHREIETLDGLVYPSRFTQATCLAIFDRAVDRLRVEEVMPLMRDPGVPTVLDDYGIELLG